MPPLRFSAAQEGPCAVIESPSGSGTNNSSTRAYESVALLERLTAFLIAPHATAGEIVLGYGAALCGSGAMIMLALHADLSALQTAVLALMGFDICGGAVVNATRAAEQRFHHAGNPAWRSVSFCAAHIHPLILAAVFPIFPMKAATIFYAGMVASCGVIRYTPAHLRSPIAYAATTMLLMAWIILLPCAGIILPPYLDWMFPVMTIKILLAHLVPRSDVNPE